MVRPTEVADGVAAGRSIHHLSFFGQTSAQGFIITGYACRLHVVAVDVSNKTLSVTTVLERQHRAGWLIFARIWSSILSTSDGVNKGRAQARY